jgi:hypothetical protein
MPIIYYTLRALLISIAELGIFQRCDKIILSATWHEAMHVYIE